MPLKIGYKCIHCKKILKRSELIIDGKNTARCPHCSGRVKDVMGKVG